MTICMTLMRQSLFIRVEHCNAQAVDQTSMFRNSISYLAKQYEEPSDEPGRRHDRPPQSALRHLQGEASGDEEDVQEGVEMDQRKLDHLEAHPGIKSKVQSSPIVFAIMYYTTIPFEFQDSPPALLLLDSEGQEPKQAPQPQDQQDFRGLFLMLPVLQPFLLLVLLHAGRRLFGHGQHPDFGDLAGRCLHIRVVKSKIIPKNSARTAKVVVMEIIPTRAATTKATSAKKPVKKIPCDETISGPQFLVCVRCTLLSTIVRLG